MYGEGAATEWTCQKSFAKFHAGDFSLDNAPLLGRPVEVDSDQIETLTENDQCYTTQEIADILKISNSIKLLLKMRNVSFILQKKHTEFLANPICVVIKLGWKGWFIASSLLLQVWAIVHRHALEGHSHCRFSTTTPDLLNQDSNVIKVLVDAWGLG